MKQKRSVPLHPNSRRKHKNEEKVFFSPDFNDAYNGIC